MNETVALGRNGKILKVRAFSPEGYSERPASLAVDNSGMSGSEGIFQRHNNDMDSMWLTTRNPGINNYIMFDFERVEQIGYMYVWNFNQSDCTGAGIRDARIFYSIDGTSWSELKGQGYPFRFARADGREWIRATNLDNDNNSPVNFSGVSARYVKIVPDERQGIGNWGAYIEGQHRYGLSEVRFYRYKPDAHPDGYLCCECYSPDNYHNIENITNSFGLSDNDSKNAVHSNEPETMWISESLPKYGILMFELDGTYPLKEMWVWNYNESGQANAGIKETRIYYSIDACSWNELKGSGYPYRFARADGENCLSATNLDDGNATPVDFGGAMARYIKLELNGGPGKGTWGCYNMLEYRYGISKVRFYASEGYCIEPARDWTGLLSRYNGWSGADGIFTAALDGRDCRRKTGEEAETRSAFIFSDTFLGEVNPVTRQRRKFNMVNNTAAYMQGINPETADMKFIFGKNGGMTLDNIISVPEEKKCTYWLQDCVVNRGKLYAFTDNVVEDLTRIEGFQFRLVGVDMISVDINKEELDFKSLKVFDTPLFRDNMYFGCGILPNTTEAGMPFADGYIYIYGLYEACPGFKSLVTARVQPEDFENFSKYQFFNGREFTGDMDSCKPICDDGASEMSMTPIEDGEFRGKYLYVYSPQSVNNTISCRIGDTPWGPFGERIPLYYITEPADLSKRTGKKIYTYNSKAHFHLSHPGELLITTNINTMDFESHINNADIYRPRFFRLRRI